MAISTVIIGSGNVASHLAPALKAVGAIDVVGVYSPTYDHARELADRLGCEVVKSLDELPESELVIVSIKDDAVAKLAKQVTQGSNAVWLHTAGSIPAKKLSPITAHYGVLYPLQTFTKGSPIDVSKVPFFVEGSDEATLAMARRLASTLSERVYDSDVKLRTKVHVAAVFACNFANYLWSISDDLLRDIDGAEFDISLLEPLMQETLRKAMALGPEAAQTGPARRKDRGVMATHAAQLDDRRAQLYNYLSESIINHYKK